MPKTLRHKPSVEMTSFRLSPSPRNRPCGSTSSRPSVRQSNANFDQFEKVAFCCLKQESRPRRWFIKLVSSPYLFDLCGVFLLLYVFIIYVQDLIIA